MPEFKQSIINECRDLMKEVLSTLTYMESIVGRRKWTIGLSDAIFTLAQSKDSPPLDTTVLHEHIRPLARLMYQLGDILLTDNLHRLEIINHKREQGEYYLVVAMINKATDQTTAIAYLVNDTHELSDNSGISLQITHREDLSCHISSV